MGLTILLTGIMMVLLWLMIWYAYLPVQETGEARRKSI